MTTKILILSLIGVILTSCNNQAKPTEKTIFISSETQPCDAGVGKMDCMQVKWSKSDKGYELFYNEIEGFNYEAGNEYELLITEEKVVNPPADASSVKYKLVKLVSKTKATQTSILIKDCPDEKIIDKMPTISNNPNDKNSNEYYIYKGLRKEISDFDNDWILKNCNVKITEVH